MSHYNQIYYVVPGDFSAFGDTVEDRLSRIAVDGSEGIVKTKIGITRTPDSLIGFSSFNWLNIIQYIADNPAKYPQPQPPDQ